MFLERKQELSLPHCKPLSAANNLESVQNFIRGQVATQRRSDIVNQSGTRISNKILLDSNAYKGSFGFFEIDEDICLAVTDVKFLRSQIFHFAGENWIRFHFRIQGNNSIVVKDLAQYEASGPYAQVCIHPEGFDRFEFYPEGEKHRWATIFCKPQSLEQKLGIDPNYLPSKFRSRIAAQSLQHYAQEITLSPKMSAAILDILDNTLSDKVLDIYRKAKVVELVCLFIDAMFQQNQKSTPGIKIKQRDADRLYEVRDRLRLDPALSLNLPRLVRETGLNRNKLAYGFREIFGLSMSEYCRQLRFIKAAELLADSELSVSEIAYMAGYSNVANFSNAYKNFYGRCPKHHRQNSLLDNRLRQANSTGRIMIQTQKNVLESQK